MRGGLRTSDGQPVRGAPRWLAERAFRRGEIPAVRRFTQAFGARAGIVPARLADLVLAVSEAAACAGAAGPCTARVRLWMAGPRAYCEVRGDGLLLAGPSAGPGLAGRPGEEEALRRTVLRRLADHVSIASGSDGVRVLLTMRVA